MERQGFLIHDTKKSPKRVSNINKWSLLMWKQLDASHHNSRLEEAIQLSHRWNKRSSKWKE
jgi:hypothetical protein